MENLKPSTSMMEEEPIYSAGTFCFNKGLCMIWNKGTLSKDKPIQSHAMTLAFILQIDRNQIFQMKYCAFL